MLFYRPYLAETYFILYRITLNNKYRKWAWELAQAIYKYCRTKSGAFSDLMDVNTVPSFKPDSQRASFISGTLKYLYLIFSDESFLPLNKWIFNTRGHPLPVCGTSVYYPKEKCK